LYTNVYKMIIWIV